MFKEEVNEEPRQYLECRVELLSVDSAWGTTWRLARLPGLGPDNTSFLFKMIHQILPTQERVSKTNPSVSPPCKSQGYAGTEVEDLEHFLQCVSNDGVGNALLELVKQHMPGITADALLRLEFDVEPTLELPLVWFVATVLQVIWDLRQSGTRIQRYRVRADLEAKVLLLRMTRHWSSAIIIETYLCKIF